MLNKSLILLFMLPLALNLAIASTHAADCRPVVAQIDHQTPLIEQVGILRNSNHYWASRKNRALCAGDVVIAPKTVPSLQVIYYSEGPYHKTLAAGEHYKVIALDNPCGVLCKLGDAINRLWTKLRYTESLSPTPTTGAVSREGKNSKAQFVFTPLADGEGSQEPFYLFARDGDIPLFWYGGKSPYQLTVKDAAGKEVIQKTTETGKFSLTTLNTEPGTKYTLTIQSSDDKTCQKNNSKICQKKLIFAIPPFPFNPNKLDKGLARLLADCNRNWRLEIWRQLQTMPDSEPKNAFVAHLKANDVSPYDRDVGLCQ